MLVSFSQAAVDPLWSGLDLEVQPGEFIAVLGPNGVGKSTLLGTILGTRQLTGGKLDVNVFFTREGRITEQWDLHEEGDAEQDLPVTGLEGFHDLSCAIGTYSAVEFEAVFEPSRWKFRLQGL